MALTALVALSPAATTTAHAQTIYNDVASFNAAAAGNTLYTFEGLASAGSGINNPDLAPLTFSVTGGANTNVNAYSGIFVGGNYTLNGTDTISAGATTDAANPAITRIALGRTFTAFATEIGQTLGGANQYRFALYLGDTQVGTTYTSPLNTPNDTFFGFTSALTFDNVRVTTVQGNNAFTLFDNVRTGNVTSSAVTAPEPGSLALLLPVVGMAGMVIRKRRGK